MNSSPRGCAPATTQSLPENLPARWREEPYVSAVDEAALARVFSRMAADPRLSELPTLVESVEVASTIPGSSFWFHLDDDQVVFQFPPSHDPVFSDRCFSLDVASFRELMEAAIKRYGRFL